MKTQEQHGISHTQANQRMTSPLTIAKCVVDMPSICLLVSSVAWTICSSVEMLAPTSRHTKRFMNTWNMLCKKTRHTLILHRRGTNVQNTDMKAEGLSFRNWSVAVCMGVVERVGHSNRQVGPTYNDYNE